MWTPAAAVLWESWRVSRVRLAVLMFLATLGGAGLIVIPLEGDWSTTLALVLAGFLALFAPWAQSVDSRTGFTMQLGFARPIRTWVLVSVPMAYVGVSCAATYLVPVIALRVAFDIPFPLLPVAALVSTLSVVFVARSWWTGDSVRQRVVPAILWLFGAIWFMSNRGGVIGLANDMAPDRWSEIFSFSATTYGWMLFISATAFGVAINGVARQRRGDDMGQREVLAILLGAEEACVLHRDPRLVRNRSQQVGIRFGEVLRLRMHERDDPHDAVPCQQWGAYCGSGISVLFFGVPIEPALVFERVCHPRRLTILHYPACQALFEGLCQTFCGLIVHFPVVGQRAFAYLALLVEYQDAAAERAHVRHGEI